MTTKTTKASAPKPKAVKKPAAKKPAVKKVPAVAKPKQSPEDKKKLQILTEEAMRAFDAGGTIPINIAVPTHVIPRAQCTIDNITARPSITELINKIKSK